MPRLMLTDEHWSKLRNIMRGHGIYDKPNLRKTVEGILYRMRTGLPWRDLPSFFCVWISIYQQFNRWASKNKLMTIFKSLVHEPNLEWEFIDGSIVKAHQHSTGAARACRQLAPPLRRPAACPRDPSLELVMGQGLNADFFV